MFILGWVIVFPFSRQGDDPTFRLESTPPACRRDLIKNYQPNLQTLLHAEPPASPIVKHVKLCFRPLSGFVLPHVVLTRCVMHKNLDAIFKVKVTIRA